MRSSRFGAMFGGIEDNEAVIKNDNKRPKFHNETRVKDSQSCFGLVV